MGEASAVALGGQAITTVGYRPLFLAGALAMAAGAALFWAAFRRPQGVGALSPLTLAPAESGDVPVR